MGSLTADVTATQHMAANLKLLCTLAQDCPTGTCNSSCSGLPCWHMQQQAAEVGDSSTLSRCFWPVKAWTPGCQLQKRTLLTRNDSAPDHSLVKAVHVHSALCRPLHSRRRRCSEKWRRCRCPGMMPILDSICRTSRTQQPAATGSLGETLSLQSSTYTSVRHGCLLTRIQSARRVPHPAGAFGARSQAWLCYKRCTVMHDDIDSLAERPCTCHIARMAARTRVLSPALLQALWGDS